jgi:hypothetical protein
MQGSTCFGDNIEDEWLIVALLRELTRIFPGSAARVWDNDGEFILIEAAYGLPSWLKPETSVNRVWLHQGELHIIPLPSRRHPTLPSVPSIAEALAIVRGDVVQTLAPQAARTALDGRVGGFPALARKHMHRCGPFSVSVSVSTYTYLDSDAKTHEAFETPVKTFFPPIFCLFPSQFSWHILVILVLLRACEVVSPRVAHLLGREPQLVAPAVEAFHIPNVDDIK